MSNLDLEKIIFPNDNNTYIIRDAQAHTDLANKADKDGSNIVGPWTMNITGHASQDIASTEKRQPGGVAELDQNGLIITSQLPSSVDEIIEGYYFNNKFYEDAQHTKEITGEASKIYIDLSSNQTYRWSGSTYVEISPSIALGVEHSTAGYGDWTNTAYLHATDANKISAAIASGLYKIAATSEGHIASLTAVTKADITALGIPAQDTTYSQGTGISIDNNNVINHSNSVTAGTAKGDDSKTLTFSGTFTIPSVTYDAQGHITTKGTTTMTMPGNPNTDRYVNSASFAHDSTNDNVKMTLTRAGSDTVTVTANIPKVSSSSAGVAPKGASVSSQSQNTKFLREDGTWAKPSYTTNTNTTYTLGTSGNNITLTPSSGSAQSITAPYATKALNNKDGESITVTYRRLDDPYYDTVYATEEEVGDLIVTGAARFLNTINGSISGNAVTATKATQDESGNNIKASYASSISISDHTITLKNKNGVSLGTVTVPDNTTDNTKLPLAGGTMTGQIVLASAALKTNDSTGWTMNQYGNLVHQRATTTDYWAIANNTGTYKFQVYYETGAVTAAGNVTAPKFIGNLQGTADYATSVAWSGITGKPNRAGSASDGGAANSSVLLNQDTTYKEGTAYVAQTSSGTIQAFCTRANNSNVGVNPSLGYGCAILSATWGGGSSYNSELFMGMGDFPYLYYRGKNNNSYTQWKQIIDAESLGFVYSSNIKYESQTRKFTITKSATGWNSSAYSTNGYIDNVYVSFKPSQTNSYIMVGLDSNPTQDAGYTNIDYTWYIQPNGALNIFESGTSIAGFTYAIGDELRIEYSGGYIKYYQNNMLKRTVARAIGEKLYMDSSFYSTSGSVYDVTFGTAPNVSKAENANLATKATTINTEVGSSAGARPVFYAYLGDNSKVVYDTTFNYNPSGGLLQTTSLSVGKRETTTAPSSAQQVNRITIVPYYHTGGPWYIASKDDSSLAYLTIKYNTSEKFIFNTNGLFTASGINITGSAGVNANFGNLGTSGGLSLYGGEPAIYGIAMRQTSNQGKHGGVQSDWGIYNFMYNVGTNRGWIWRDSSRNANVASIDCAGNAVFNGYVGIGGNTTNTSGVRQVYNSTTKSLDFVFVA